MCCIATQAVTFNHITSWAQTRSKGEMWNLVTANIQQWDIMKTFLKAFLFSQSVVVDTNSPRPLTATSIKLFPQKRFVLTGSFSLQQLCLPAVFKYWSSATGLCRHRTTTQKIHQSFQIVVFSATCDLWIYSFCYANNTHTRWEESLAKSTSFQQD